MSKKKQSYFETAVCSCKQVVRSKIPRRPKAGEDALVQGVNCTRCGALHIFSTDSDHVETMFRFIELAQFYRIAEVMVRDGVLAELNEEKPESDDPKFCPHKTTDVLYTSKDGRIRVEQCTWGCGSYIVHSMNKNNIWSLVAVVNPLGEEE